MNGCFRNFSLTRQNDLEKHVQLVQVLGYADDNDDYREAYEGLYGRRIECAADLGVFKVVKEVGKTSDSDGFACDSVVRSSLSTWLYYFKCGVY